MTPLTKLAPTHAWTVAALLLAALVLFGFHIHAVPAALLLAALAGLLVVVFNDRIHRVV